MTQNLNGYMEQLLMKTQEKMKPGETRCVHEMMLQDIKNSADNRMTSALNAALAKYERAKAENNQIVIEALSTKLRKRDEANPMPDSESVT